MAPARVPEAREWVLTKRCTVCDETKPWVAFAPAKYFADGGVRCVQSRCNRCKTRLQGEAGWGREYWHRNAETMRAKNRVRMAQRRRRMREERRSNGGWLPIEPFRGWVLEGLAEFDGNWMALSSACGVTPRTLRRAAGKERCKTRFVALDVVDRALTRRGDHLNDLYPLEAW